MSECECASRNMGDFNRSKKKFGLTARLNKRRQNTVARCFASLYRAKYDKIKKFNQFLDSQNSRQANYRALQHKIPPPTTLSAR